ncbi:MAG: hypothetical protein FWG50_02705 [Kiritimatiellaeota bacterium]|nr:hypothetical protein [Kiritimatiellota bacterium]
MLNILLQLKNKYSERNYIRKADPKCDYWFDFSCQKLDGYIKRFNDNFNICIIGDKDEAKDFYIIPFMCVKHLFIEKHLAKDQNRSPRWVGNIIEGGLKITNCEIEFNCRQYYGNIKLIETRI